MFVLDALQHVQEATKDTRIEMSDARMDDMEKIPWILEKIL